MSEDPPTESIRIPQPLMLVTAVAAGLALCAILLLLSARSAGAAVLSQASSSVSTLTGSTLGSLRSSTAVSTITGMVGGVSSSTLEVVASAASSPDPLVSSVRAVTADVTQALGTTDTVMGATSGGLSRLVPGLPISALPVASPPAPLVLGGVVNQGPQTTPTPPRGPTSVAAPGVVIHTTGSAELLFPTLPVRSSPRGGPQPLNPAPPQHPGAPELPPVAAGASVGLGIHSGTLDALPPAILVLALLAVSGVFLEHRRRPKVRFDLSFSPPG